MSMDFLGWARYVPGIQKVWKGVAGQVLGEDLKLVLGQQDRLERGSDTWANPVSYDKLGECVFCCQRVWEGRSRVFGVAGGPAACGVVALQLQWRVAPIFPVERTVRQVLTHIGWHVFVALVSLAAGVRYRRWRNGVASGRLPDGTTGSGSSQQAAIKMTAGELFRLEENEGFCDLEFMQQQQQQEQQQEVRTQA
jgi:hypothetical protein